jgi:hypothetical protein
MDEMEENQTDQKQANRIELLALIAILIFLGFWLWVERAY